jgi:hypothetical protein
MAAGGNSGPGPIRGRRAAFEFRMFSSKRFMF